MKRGVRHLHFYTTPDAVVVEVLQDDAVVANACDELFTEGLGPCIGVAFSWRGQGFMFHGAGMHHTNEFEAFLDRTCKALTASDRQEIRPVVAGGNVTGGVGDDVLDSRRFCLAKLSEYGFGNPHEQWCLDHCAQAIYLNVHSDTVRVHTESMSFSDTLEKTVLDILNR